MKVCVICGADVPGARLRNYGGHTMTCCLVCSARLERRRKNESRRRRRMALAGLMAPRVRQSAEERRASQREWRESHPERMRELRRAYRERNPDKAKAWSDRWNIKRTAAVRALKELGIDL